MQIAPKRLARQGMAHKDILRLLEADLKSVEASIRRHYQSNVAAIPMVSEYLTNGGGKRMRPILVLLSARLSGYEGGGQEIVHSTVVEYIHAATLLHDDVVDDSDTRRGMPSAGSKFGNPMAVLVGDYLFAKSFSLMAEGSSPEIIRTVSEATRHLAEGEVLQLVYNGEIGMTEEQYLEVVFRKTAALISACCQIGAQLGVVTKEQERSLEIFGRNIGIAFQIVDDVLDFTSDQKTLGKPAGQDLAEGHVTLPVIHAYRNASPADRKVLSSAAKDETFARERIGEVIAIIQRNDGIGYPTRLAEKYTDEAMRALDAFPAGTWTEALAGLANYIIHRRH